MQERKEDFPSVPSRASHHLSWLSRLVGGPKTNKKTTCGRDSICSSCLLTHSLCDGSVFLRPLFLGSSLSVYIMFCIGIL